MPLPKSRSDTKRRHRYQCRKVIGPAGKQCGKRLTLKQEAEGLVKCPSCGHPMISQESARNRELEKQEQCGCSGVEFPHQKGSVLGCEWHPGTEEMSDEEYLDWRAMQNTQRG